MIFDYSKHSIEEMQKRGISMDIVESVLSNPHQIIPQNNNEIYQSIIKFENEGNYLVRIFVNKDVTPNKVITVYRTLKITKYYEGEI